MTGVSLPEAPGGAMEPSTTDDKKPEFGDPYVAWLERTWQGDTRELREGRFLHQQADLRQAFEGSDYWKEVATKLSEWAECYRKESGAPLFQATPTLPRLASKPWQSFLNRTWRENVRNNQSWPDPPQGGWWLPDNWFERVWDAVRTRFVVRYMDGVRVVSTGLIRLAEEAGLEARSEAEAKQDGYWAFHTNIRQPFEVVALDYEGTQERSSEVEIQVMTQLAEVISELTHTYYEARRVNPPSETPVFWDEDSPEADAIGLSYQSREVDRRLLQLRRKVRSLNDG